VLLLGQKVSRLGLSTHKEKVDAILQLEEPKNVHDLQVFLGMMFISHPTYHFTLGSLDHCLLAKERKKWEWFPLHSEAFEFMQASAN